MYIQTSKSHARKEIRQTINGIHMINFIYIPFCTYQYPHETATSIIFHRNSHQETPDLWKILKMNKFCLG